MTDTSPPAIPDEELDAYALLSKPTLDLSPREVTAVVEDLRKRRLRYVQSGIADKPVKKKALADPKATPAEKKAATADLLAKLGGIKLPGVN